MNNERIVQVSRHAGGIQIYISAENLHDLAERNPDNPLHIVDSDKFLNEYVHQLREYQESNDVETGCSHLEWLIDECIQQVYESGSESIETLNDEEL